MAKLIITTKDNEKYTLEFNRATIVELEQKGFNIETVEKNPIGVLTTLSRGAFAMHHPNLKTSEIDAIVDDIKAQPKTGDRQKDKDNSFLTALVSIYADAVSALVDGKEQGNATWVRA